MQSVRVRSVRQKQAAVPPLVRVSRLAAENGLSRRLHLVLVLAAAEARSAYRHRIGGPGGCYLLELSHHKVLHALLARRKRVLIRVRVAQDLLVDRGVLGVHVVLHRLVRQRHSRPPPHPTLLLLVSALHAAVMQLLHCCPSSLPQLSLLRLDCALLLLLHPHLMLTLMQLLLVHHLDPLGVLTSAVLLLEIPVHILRLPSLVPVRVCVVRSFMQLRRLGRIC